MTGTLLAVAIDAPLRRLFDYRAPPSVDPARLRPGQRVWVPFGRRKAVGVIVELRERSDVPEARLKSAIALVDEQPVIDETLLELLRWSADYYRHAPGEVIAAALPVAIRNGADALATTERWILSAAARTGSAAPLSARAGKLRELAAWLEAHGPSGAAELAALSPRWREHVRELEKRGWVTRVQQDVEPLPAGAAIAGAARLELTPEQHAAVDAIDAAHGQLCAVRAARRDRQRQDRGLPACHRRGGRHAASRRWCWCRRSR